MRNFLTVLAVLFSSTLPSFADVAIESAPLTCADVAISKNWTTEQAIALCYGAESSTPVACAEIALKKSWTAEQAVTLCSGVTVTNTPILCADSAIKKNWAPDQAIRLCRTR